MYSSIKLRQKPQLPQINLLMCGTSKCQKRLSRPCNGFGFTHFLCVVPSVTTSVNGCWQVVVSTFEADIVSQFDLD